MFYDLLHSRCLEKNIGSLDILFITICRVCFLPIVIIFGVAS